jgi:RimJ/RimL family protein N-acetyltransferase
VARVALDEQCYGIHWEVLDWNEKAIGLYKALGAEFLHQRKHVLLTGRSLERLAEQVQPSS